MEDQVKMITLFGKEPKKMNRTEIRREIRAQKSLLRAIKRARGVKVYKHEKKGFDIDAAEAELKEIKWLYTSWQMELPEYRKRLRSLNMSIAHAIAREDVIELYDIYIKNLEAHIAELEFYKERRQEDRAYVTDIYQHRKNAKKRFAKIQADNNIVWNYNRTMDRDTTAITWDRDKFNLIAKDRGYQTESSVILAIQEELQVDRARAQAMYNRGRFTWGQVMCLGALMQMTPKEFCDTFLSGYFNDYYGEYRASYANLNKSELLKRAITPAAAPKEPEEIKTDSSGKPEDEVVWFD